MIKIKLQLFGGRGAYSGINKIGGINLGRGSISLGGSGKKVTRGQIEKLINDYPQFPDPDYSKHKLINGDKFMKNCHNLFEYKRDNFKNTIDPFVKQFMIPHRVDTSYEFQDSSYGYVQLYIDDFKKLRCDKYSLSSVDSRRMEYKIKTMLHEGTHLKKDGFEPHTYNLKNSKWREIEEFRTECTAMYLANKMNGYNYLPSYTNLMDKFFAKAIQLKEYNHCSTIYDLGKEFYKETYINKKPLEYVKMYDKIEAVKIPEKYQKQLRSKIVQNRKEYSDIIKNSLANYKYYDQSYINRFERDLNRTIAKIRNNDEKSMTDLENYYFQKLKSLAMNDNRKVDEIIPGQISIDEL